MGWAPPNAAGFQKTFNDLGRLTRLEFLWRSRDLCSRQGTCGDPVQQARNLTLAPGLCGNALAALERALRGRLVMFDAIYLAIGFGFLVIAVFYVVACDRI